MWSIDCAPCRGELELLAELSAEYPRLVAVLIATDDVERAAEAAQIASAYLPSAESWIFTLFGASFPASPASLKSCCTFLR